MHFNRNFGGPGCQIAGFLTVFSSELSVFTLTVITLERWYAITYAIHLNRRLHLGAAGRVMAAGWLYSLGAAAAPLAGVSGYSRTSICLPMDNRTALGVAYLAGLLAVKGIAFAVICVCYLKMYLSIRSSGTGQTHLNRYGVECAKKKVELRIGFFSSLYRSTLLSRKYVTFSNKHQSFCESWNSFS